MRLSIGEAARLCSVSVRTLRYYDSIGLLSPCEVSDSGYRYYSGEELSRLWQILFFRELDFSLSDISAILSNPNYDRARALRNHRELLISRRKRLEELTALVEKAIEGEIEMTDIRDGGSEYERLKKQYADEARLRWGDTPQYAESEQKASSRTAGDSAGVEAQADEIFAAFAAARELPADSPEARELVERWREHITRNYYECTPEILACLADMYVGDDRFRENLDRFGEGTAEFMARAIKVYCG